MPRSAPTFFRWALLRPLRRPLPVVAIVLLSLAIAPLRVATVASTLPALKVLLNTEWREALRRIPEHTPGWLRESAARLAGFLTAGTAFEALLWLMGAMLALAAVRALLVVVQEGLTGFVVHESVQDVAVEVHRAVLRGAGQDRPRGELLTHFSADLEALRQTLKRVYGKVLREPFNLVGTLALLVVLDWRLALWTGVVFPLGAGLLLALSRRLRSTSQRTLDRTGGLLAQVEESLHGLRVVWSFGLEDRERRRFDASLEDLTRNLVTLDRREALASPLLEILGLMAGAACVLLGAARVLDAELTKEAFLTFYFALIMVLDPLRKLADTGVRVHGGQAAAARLLALLRTTPAAPPVAGTTPFPGVRQGIQWQHVGVRSNGGAALLEDVSFTAEPGQVILIAGPSGAGKSTLLDVQAGLRPYHEGSLRMDGAELRSLRAADFHEQVALVAQETFLFRGTLAENVTLGRSPRGMSLERALECAGLTALVGGLRRGPATPVEEHAFSAGERQRLCLARALYRDPAVLLLDEATSALDRPLAEKVLEQVLALRRDRITFLVTHQISTTLPVDWVVVLEGGRIHHEGTREELLGASELFRSLLLGTPP